MTELLTDDQVLIQEARWHQAIERMATEVPLWYYHAKRLHLTMCRGWNTTAAVDGVNLYWNPEFTAQQDDKQLLFLVTHEVWHVASGHIWRGEVHTKGLEGMELQKVLRRWGEAIDYAIHQHMVPLLNSGHYPNMRFIPSGIYDAKYTGMSAEQIYQDLLQDEQAGERNPDPGDGPPSLDIHILRGQGDAPDGAMVGTDGSWVVIVDGNGNPLQPDEDNPGPDPMNIQGLKGQIRRGLAQEQNLEPVVVNTHGTASGYSWEDALKNFVIGCARGDYSYARPNRQYLSQHNLIVPGLYSPKVSIKFAIDTSSSMDQKKLDKCGTEIEAARAQIGEHELELIPCSSYILRDKNTKEKKTQTVTTGQPLDWTVQSGGGTSFRPVFNYLAEKGERITCLVYFTDCDGVFPEHEPDYPVLWVVCKDGGQWNPTPWGERVEI